MRGIIQNSGDDSLAVRAAWLHYAGGLTQAEVAKRLGIANVKAHRLINRANQAGMVKVTIDGEISDCVALEGQLAALFGLAYCEVTPDLGEGQLPARALGISGAAFLRREIESGRNTVIGLGHGRTLAALVRNLPHFDARPVKFVSLLGGLTRNYEANPHDVMHRLADKTRAAAYFMPVPFFANSVEDREVLLDQHGVHEVLELATHSELKLVGIGVVKQDAQLVATGMIQPEEISDVIAKGGVGEILGHFFDAEGHPIETALTDRTLSVPMKPLSGTRIVAIAGGEEKVGAIRSVLLSGHLNGLITDERTATALVTQASN